MRYQTKRAVCLCGMLLLLGLFPWITDAFAQPHEVMGLMMLRFLLLYPLVSLLLGGWIGRDWRRLWWLIPLFSALYLVFFWVHLWDLVWDLAIYAVGYLLLGGFSMLCSSLISYAFRKKRS